MRAQIIGMLAVLLMLNACDCGTDGTCGSKDSVSVSVDGMETSDAGSVSSQEGDIKKSFPLDDRIYFDTDKYSLVSESQKILADQAEWLKTNPGVAIVVEGHCDERGTREYNLALGERRANSARDYLISLGIDSNRITVISYGKDRPVAPESTPEGWAKNRVSISVVQINS